MKHLHLFGGGALVPLAIEIAAAHGWDAVLRTSPRLWNPDNALARRVAELGVEVFVSAKLDEVMAMGPAPQPGDVGLSFGAPWIFRAGFIAEWQGHLFNCHGRPLPRHRGAGGPSWLILMDERAGMAAIHELTAGVDDGPIVAAAPFHYPDNVVTPADFDAEDERRGAALLADFLPGALAGEVARDAQDEARSTYWPRLSTDLHGWIDWSWTAAEIERFCRAFGPAYAGARTCVRGGLARVRSCTRGESDDFHPFQAGLIYRIDGDSLFVAARGGGLRIELDVAARVGDRLFTPRALLERALATRVTYLPDGSLRTELACPPELISGPGREA